MGSINLNNVNDSILALIDNMLIASDMHNKDAQQSVMSEKDKIEIPLNMTTLSQEEDPIIAEVNISGSFNPGKVPGRKNIFKHKNVQELENQVYWIPVLEIDERGIATVEYETDNKNQRFYVNIQGLSHNGLVGYQNFSIDPQTIKVKKNYRKRR